MLVSICQRRHTEKETLSILGICKSSTFGNCYVELFSGLILLMPSQKQSIVEKVKVKHELSFSSVLGPNVIYNSKNQGDSGSGGHLHMLSTSVLHRPERPDQPECRYFISIGSCKYGSDCKYNHLMKRSSAIHLSAIVSTIATTT
ncbi:putative zinc finger CCCH domain-containing protein 64 isoform X4 [Cornus florida]|uniref:putative zinc finger CCCH domain-containing protein 64 isoform X4 n=1 Tax=Cornus florida TaxID=4283 RepID=UPI0028A2B78C|nr:putative zinc finger CCCH domain-containing protein 64 isoform X4 [Cornus florida]